MNYFEISLLAGVGIFITIKILQAVVNFRASQLLKRIASGIESGLAPSPPQVPEALLSALGDIAEAIKAQNHAPAPSFHESKSPSDDALARAFELEKQNLRKRIDQLRGEVADLQIELKDACAEAAHWKAGGDLRQQLIDDQIKRLRPLVGKRIDFAQNAIDLLQREGDILDLRAESEEA